MIGRLPFLADIHIPVDIGLSGAAAAVDVPFWDARRGSVVARVPGPLDVERAARLAAAVALLAPTAAAVAARCGAAGGDAVRAGDAAGGALRC